MQKLVDVFDQVIEFFGGVSDLLEQFALFVGGRLGVHAQELHQAHEPGQRRPYLV